MEKHILFAAVAAFLAVCPASAHSDARIRAFAAQGPHALSDRLFMYWNTHAEDVFVRDRAVVSVGGGRAPVPTVMFSGNRSHVTDCVRPKIEDLPPRSEDPRGLYLESKTSGTKMWFPFGKTGCTIDSVNTEIVSIARDAAILAEKEPEDADTLREMAFNVLDTYLSGILHRNVPTDLGGGHMQTLFGMQSMETIHDSTLGPCCALYKALKPYIGARHPDALARMQSALKKWADVQEANGVADNNWDIMQLNAILDVAMVLDSNQSYPDGKGREYYLDTVMNRSSVRNLSVRDLCAKGFDPATGIWWECPGYSLVTLNDLSKFAAKIKEAAGIDLMEEIPVLKKAFAAAGEYLFPDGMTIGFGDTHPGPLGELVLSRAKPVQSPFFYAPNASWLVARSGMDRMEDVAFALNASLGNHQHANGISMELYAGGYRIAPDAGIGWQLYSGEDYQEYYSRFPAHNTVMVNSRSNYTTMKSYHPFKLLGNGDNWACVEFREPATGAEQRRTVAYVKRGGNRYFVDCFRSRTSDSCGGQWHDYYYHNFGDVLELPGADRPTEKIAFVESGLYGLSYIKDKFERPGDSDVEAVFRWTRPEGEVVTRFFMNGAPGRTFIKGLAPATEGLSRCKNPDYGITRESRTPVIVARQDGDAWNSPFMAVIDPSSCVDGVEYSADGISVRLKDGSSDIFRFPVSHPHFIQETKAQ